MTRFRLIAAATLGHVGLLGGAFLFQAFGYAPCAMCLWQRWPHAAAILFGIAALAGVAPRVTAALAGLSALTTSGIGFYHAGVEQGFWPGPTSCTGTGGDLSALTGADLLSTEIADTVIMCDEIVWQLFWISMAGWNALLSLALAGIWFMAVRARV
ncbi:disulfide bond formation protein B [Jannaschia seohaensis]|uniref:Disulfide bond formation protein DsbB n=1 Tax=Jannaschia seohaensis TaxID=475081 RepID=A0A2Y9AIW9_9RHOB|nr:disulfide bond formation protein B [Jannaschia seohaensis]PWJ20374.1 disulfide bond formation protein DsbB [Jannaschia seohaensis]SSA44434.1 Disulfide bond formation protein DsbB [Jannaschia seohaensis]